MMKYTPLQTVNKCHRELWWTIRLMGAAEVQLDEKSKERIDLGEVEKVLRAAVVELGLIIARWEGKDANQRINRPGADLALKAIEQKGANSRAKLTQSRPSEASHK